MVIPLLFGLIAGASGFYLAREDISQKGGRERLAFVGACVTSLCLGLILMGTATFWTQSHFQPKTLQELIGAAQAPNYEEQMLALETRAIAGLLGADPREQSKIVQAAVLGERTDLKPSVDNETIEAIEKEIIEAIAEIANLAPLNANNEAEADDYVSSFNLTLGYSRALLVLNEQANLEQQLWQQYLARMFDLVERIVGSENSFNYAYFLRISNEDPGALSLMIRLRSIGARWHLLTSGRDGESVLKTETLSQSRVELIKLLQGQNDEIAFDSRGYFPQLAENRRSPAGLNFDQLMGPS